MKKSASILIAWVGMCRVLVAGMIFRTHMVAATICTLCGGILLGIISAAASDDW